MTTTGTRYRTEVRFVTPNELTVDHSYQRPFDPKRAEPGGDLHPFNPTVVGAFEVSQREDGTLVLVDAQHRCVAAQIQGFGETEFPAVVHSGLSVADEAALFLVKNASKNMHPNHKFKARVAASEPVAVILVELLSKHGWKVPGTDRKGGTFGAIGAFEDIYNGAKIRKEGHQYAVCDATLEALTAAFGRSPHAVKKELVKGIGLTFLRYGDQVDTAKLTTEMGKFKGAALGLIASAKQLKQIRGGSADQAMAEILVELHNKGRRTRVLPQWTRST